MVHVPNLLVPFALTIVGAAPGATPGANPRPAPSASTASRPSAALNASAAASASSVSRAMAASGASPLASGGDLVAVQAGTILLVENGAVFEGGGTILIRNGKIEAVSRGLEAPAGARVIDYGPDAVIAPGLVAADSNYGSPRSSDRTADPFLRAIDNFDPYASYVFALQEGVTSAYFAPARGRLVAGQGAVIKLGGGSGADPVLNAQAAIHAAVTAEARFTPGYWEPPIPATSDVGLGVAKDQLPRSLMGAIVALGELFDLENDAASVGEYGRGVGVALQDLMKANVPWRVSADSAVEMRAVLEFFRKHGQRVILDGANDAAEMATEIAAAGASVIVESPVAPNSGGRDWGKSDDAKWPRYDAPAALAKQGVRFAIAPPLAGAIGDLRFAAQVMSRGGLDRDAALRAITLAPAQILGVGERVGSLAVGKDADLVVFNGHPLDATSSVQATWVNGEVAFKAYETSAVVVHVDELYLGDGTVLAPGEVLMEKGRVVDVGRKVGRPRGAVLVRGKAAMPGMIDALGHLGLEGSTRVPAARYQLQRIVEPGDAADRRVAKSGVTTVAMSPRGASRGGAPVLAYKPAGDDLTSIVIADPCALRFQWTDRNRRQSGSAMRDVLEKALEYKKKWEEYEKKLAAWTPPKEAAAAADASAKTSDAKSEAKDGDKKDGEKKEGEADAEKKDDGKGSADKKDDKKDDKKKKKGEEEPPKPITGAWETKITVAPLAETRLRLYVNDEDGRISGTLRCDALSSTLIEVTGTREKHKVSLSGQGSEGLVLLEAEAKDGKLKGHVALGETRAEFEAAQTATTFEVVRRGELRKPKDEKAPDSGAPRAPSIDIELEPLRRAMKGAAAVIVGVDRDDEILACVEAFEKAGIKPILYGANDAWKVLDQLRGRVAGILLSQRIVWTEPKTGAEKRNRYAELVSSGIPVAFHSDAEEGAAELPLIAAYAVSQGMSPEAALRALTLGAAEMLAIDTRVGRIAQGFDADLVLLDGSPLESRTSIVRVWVSGKEVR